MIIRKCEFIKSAADYSGFIIADVPQIVVSGKSNVGKSSFINFLTNNSKLSKTSNTPGRTRLVNYFAINDFLLVDLPGYGYAKGAKREVESWGKLMDNFFHKCRPFIKHVIVLVDIRHLPSKEDMEFVQFLNICRFSFSIIATKSDKLSRMVIKQNLAKIATALKIGIDDIFAISSTNKVGKEQVLDLLEQALSVEKVTITDDDSEFEDYIDVDECTEDDSEMSEVDLEINFNHK